MKEIDRITGLLKSEVIEKQIAAAIVLGELEAKTANKALVDALSTSGTVVQRHVLEALAKIGAKPSLAVILPFAFARDASLRDAAKRAIASVGDDAVAVIRERAKTATPDERRVLDGVLAELGGSEAFFTILGGLESSDPEVAREAALKVRTEVKNASGHARRSYLAHTEKLIEKLKKKPDAGPALVAAVKILGYLEDPRAVPTLKEIATSKKMSGDVRREALIALRFASKEVDKSLPKMLLDAVQDPDRAYAQAALHTLGSIELPDGAVPVLTKLAADPDFERSRVAIEALARMDNSDAIGALVDLVAAGEQKRADAAAIALLPKPPPGAPSGGAPNYTNGARKEAAVLIAKAVMNATAADRAMKMKVLLKPHARELSPAHRKGLRDAALDAVREGHASTDSLLELAREIDQKGTTEGLRELAARLRKGRKPADEARVLQLLLRGDHSTDEDRYRLATLALARSAKDTNPAARQRDEALARILDLLKHRFDVFAAMKSDKSLEAPDLYYVGFHFAESGHPLGEDLLQLVIDRGGRTKIGTMAKNKLKLLRRTEGDDA